MESEVIGAIVGIIIALVSSVSIWAKFKKRFSSVVDLLMTLDAAWKDDRITDEEWNAIWDRLQRLVANAPTKGPGEN